MVCSIISENYCFLSLGSPSTTSTVESVAVYVEASSVKLFSVFKDWIETKYFVYSKSGHVYGLVKTIIRYSVEYTGWPSVISCTDCKSGEAMRSILEGVKWPQVFSGEIAAINVSFNFMFFTYRIICRIINRRKFLLKQDMRSPMGLKIMQSKPFSSMW